MRRIHVLTVLIALLIVLVPNFAFGACDLNATPSNFASQLSAAQPGQTLCLAGGSYGSFAGVTKSSPGVTITAASGATPTMSINFLSSPVPAWLIFDGLTISGGTISGPAHDLVFKNSTFTDKLTIWASANNNACSNCSAMNGSNIVFDNDTFNMAANPNGVGGYEGRVQFNSGGSTPAGITIKNSKFTTGCADGIQFGGAGAGHGVTVGPNNEFYNLLQGSCGPHVDSIQFNGDENSPNSNVGPVITGNYFHNDTTGIVSYDYDTNATITNNVLVGISGAIGLAGFDSTSIAEHNTVINGDISCDVTHESNVCRATIRNNITRSVVLTSSGGTGSPSVNDYNMCTGGGCAGSHSLSGTPTFVGGSSPSSYAGYALTSTSLGHQAASDGKDMGITVSGSSTSTAPAAPTNLKVVVQ